MTTVKLSSCFLNHVWFGAGGGVGSSNSSRFVDFSFIHRHRCRLRVPPPASCKMRPRGFGAQHKRQQAKKTSPKQPQIDAQLQPNGEAGVEVDNASVNSNSSPWQDILSKSDDENIISQLDNSNVPPNNDVDSSAKALSIQGEEKLSSNQFDDLIIMVKNAEKNVLLLNQARVRALENLEKILVEKDALQGEINVLETKLAETDAKIKVVTQDKIHVELLQDQLEKMRKELSERSLTEEGIHEVPNNKFPASWNTEFHSLSMELGSLKAENASLKDDLQALKAELSNVNLTNEKVATLENERVRLESMVKDLVTKLIASQEDVSRLSTMEYEHNNLCRLCEKVHNLQALLDDATKQAEQAVLVLQQNQELRKKVERLEESLGEAHVNKTSSEKMQKYDEKMEQKIKLLEECFKRSDGEFDSYVYLYQESIKEFQDILNNLKQESEDKCDRPDRMQDNLNHNRINPIKGVVVFSNIVTTVSPTYAQEVWTPEGGKGLHSTLNTHSKEFIGILNGIDTDTWSPATDSFIEVQYTWTVMLRLHE